MAKAQTNRQVSIPGKLAYGVGHSIISAKNTLFHFFFMFYFSNVLGLEEGIVFLAILIALLFDAFSDPIMGQISDNFRSEKWGRRHGFMLAGIIPTAVALALLFAPPSSLSPTLLFCWILFFTIIVRLGLTIYGVPYYTLGAELSTDYDERTSIFGYREFFNSFFGLGIFLIGVLLFLKPEAPGENGWLNQSAYPPFVMTVAVLGVIFSMISIFGTKHKIPTLNRFENDQLTSWKQTLSELKTAIRIKPFVWLCSGYSMMVILYGGASALGLYHLNYLWKLTETQSLIVIIAPLFTILPAAILASVLSKKLGKKTATIVLGAVYILCGVLPNGAYLLGMLPAIGTTGLLATIAVFNGIAFMGFIGVVITSNSMMADVVDLMDTKTGKRQEGLLYSAFSFAQKMTFVFGVFISAITLKILNFPKQSNPEDVPQHIVDGFAVATIVTCLMCGLISLYCFSRYILSKSQLLDIQNSLNIQ